MEKKERNELKNRFIDNGWSYKFEEYQDGDISQFELEEFFLDFAEQEIDKAREEGREEGWKECEEFYGDMREILRPYHKEAEDYRTTLKRLLKLKEDK